MKDYDKLSLTPEIDKLHKIAESFKTKEQLYAEGFVTALHLKSIGVVEKKKLKEILDKFFYDADVDGRKQSYRLYEADIKHLYEALELW